MDASALSYCDLSDVETASLSDSLLTALIFLQAMEILWTQIWQSVPEVL